MIRKRATQTLVIRNEKWKSSLPALQFQAHFTLAFRRWKISQSEWESYCISRICPTIPERIRIKWKDYWTRFVTDMTRIEHCEHLYIRIICYFTIFFHIKKRYKLSLWEESFWITLGRSIVVIVVIVVRLNWLVGRFRRLSPISSSITGNKKEQQY